LDIETAAPAILAATRIARNLVVYVAGLGATDPFLSEGLPAPAAPFFRTLLQPSVLINSQPLTVSFSGLVPGFVGLYQINAVLPKDVPFNFEIIVEVGNHRSQPFQWDRIFSPGRGR